MTTQWYAPQINTACHMLSSALYQCWVSLPADGINSGWRRQREVKTYRRNKTLMTGGTTDTPPGDRTGVKYDTLVTRAHLNHTSDPQCCFYDGKIHIQRHNIIDRTNHKSYHESFCWLAASIALLANDVINKLNSDKQYHDFGRFCLNITITRCA